MAHFFGVSGLLPARGGDGQDTLPGWANGIRNASALGSLQDADNGDRPRPAPKCENSPEMAARGSELDVVFRRRLLSARPIVEVPIRSGGSGGDLDNRHHGQNRRRKIEISLESEPRATMSSRMAPERQNTVQIRVQHRTGAISVVVRGRDMRCRGLLVPHRQGLAQ